MFLLPSAELRANFQQTKYLPDKLAAFDVSGLMCVLFRVACVVIAHTRDLFLRSVIDLNLLTERTTWKSNCTETRDVSTIIKLIFINSSENQSVRGIICARRIRRSFTKSAALSVKYINKEQSVCVCVQNGQSSAAAARDRTSRSYETADGFKREPTVIYAVGTHSHTRSALLVVPTFFRFNS